LGFCECLAFSGRAGCLFTASSHKGIGILHKSQKHENFILDPRFSVDVSDVDLYGAHGYIEHIGDLLVGETREAAPLKRARDEDQILEGVQSRSECLN